MKRLPLRSLRAIMSCWWSWAAVRVRLDCEAHIARGPEWRGRERRTDLLWSDALEFGEAGLELGRELEVRDERVARRRRLVHAERALELEARAQFRETLEECLRATLVAGRGQRPRRRRTHHNAGMRGSSACSGRLTTEEWWVFMFRAGKQLVLIVRGAAKGRRWAPLLYSCWDFSPKSWLWTKFHIVGAFLTITALTPIENEYKIEYYKFNKKTGY